MARLKFSRSNFSSGHFEELSTERKQTLLLPLDRKSGICHHMAPLWMLYIMTLINVFNVTNCEKWISGKWWQLAKILNNDTIQLIQGWRHKSDSLVNVRRGVAGVDVAPKVYDFCDRFYRLYLSIVWPGVDRCWYFAPWSSVRMCADPYFRLEERTATGQGFPPAEPHRQRSLSRCQACRQWLCQNR